MRKALKYWQAALLMVVATGSSGVVGQAQTPLDTILTFTGPNGSTPSCVLLGDTRGNIYGTANGGSSGAGIVFMLTPPLSPGGAWTENVLYNFTGKADGGVPGDGLVFDTAGALYGTTYSGGASGNGTVFQLKPPTSGSGSWTETVLYSFSTRHGGTNPHNGLVFGRAGQLYGTAGGGNTGYGVAFEVKPPASGTGPWTETVLHEFAGAGDGADPDGGLVIGIQGLLYGMTNFGGAYNAGTVYALKPPSMAGDGWTESVLHSFDNDDGDGSAPVGSLVFSSSGTAYGVTSAGGSRGFGTVFELKPPAASGDAWTETVLYSFGGGSDGATPTGPLVFGTGTLYGTTAYGGTDGDGTIFQLTAPGASGGAWTEASLHSFAGTDGQNPSYGVVFAANGALFGTTEFGGPAGLGTVFELFTP